MAAIQPAPPAGYELPPPRTEVGVIGWLTANLFSTWYNTTLTILAGAGIVLAVWYGLAWIFAGADWTVIAKLGGRFVIGQYNTDAACPGNNCFWRPQASLLLVIALLGMAWGLKGNAVARNIAVAVTAAAAAFAFLPYSLERMGLDVRLLLLAGIPALGVGYALARFTPLGSGMRITIAGVVIFLLTLLLLRGLPADWSVPGLQPVGVIYWGGLMLNLILAVGGITLSLPIGVALALGRRSNLSLPLYIPLAALFGFTAALGHTWVLSGGFMPLLPGIVLILSFGIALSASRGSLAALLIANVISLGFGAILGGVLAVNLDLALPGLITRLVLIIDAVVLGLVLVLGRGLQPPVVKALCVLPGKVQALLQQRNLLLPVAKDLGVLQGKLQTLLQQRDLEFPVVKALCVTFIEVFRGVPLITLLFMSQVLVPLAFPQDFPLNSLFRAGIIITMFSAAYMAENIRGGLQSLHPGQAEAARALGLAGWQTTLLISLPQAIRNVIPAIVGQFIGLFKDTSLVYIIAMLDIVETGRTFILGNPEYLQSAREVFVFVAIVFWVFTYGMSYVSSKVEESLGVGRR